MFQDFVSSLLWPHGEGLEAAKCTTCLIGCRELSKILMVSFEVTSIEKPRTDSTCRVDHPRRARGGLPNLLRPAAHHLLLLGAGAGLLRGPGDRGWPAFEGGMPGSS